MLATFKHILKINLFDLNYLLQILHRQGFSKLEDILKTGPYYVRKIAQSMKGNAIYNVYNVYVLSSRQYGAVSQQYSIIMSTVKRQASVSQLHRFSSRSQQLIHCFLRLPGQTKLGSTLEYNDYVISNTRQFFIYVFI